ncbi:Chromatin structure-remodeling complex protein rsc9 [Actinomortierella ambigua]|nr:Chromatin structure-remodeling complex protein rsc9 [Actinomortierella ambigua]
MGKHTRREGTIDYSEEYKKFMDRLEAFHRKHGTVLNREPVLGSQRLDLLKVYKLVTAHGGCEKVTQERGWKKITLPFNFPPTCTNSAYVMKSVYVKNLELFEQEDFFGREVPVNHHDPPESNITRSREASQAPTTRRAAFQAANANRPTPQPVHQPQPQVQYHQPQPQQHIVQPAVVPRSTNVMEGYFIEGGHQNRILLALRSELPNEVDWAFNKLIALSFEWHEFSLNMVPGLLEELLTFVQPLFGWIQSVETRQLEDLSEDDVAALNDNFNLERVLQVFHVIRNVSFLEHNTRSLSEVAALRKMLQQGLNLPSIGQLGELRVYCLETLESLSEHIILRTKFDLYLQQLHGLIASNDRTLILGGLRSLIRLASNEHNERILGDIDPDVILRISQLLLIKDEELVGTALDYLYQYSSFNGETPIQIAKNFPGNIVSMLVGFLSWGSPKSLPGPAIVDPAQQIQHEPYRALHWLQSNFELNPNSWMYEADLFSLYSTRFGNQGPMLRSPDLVTVAKVGFPAIEQQIVQNPEGGQPQQVIKGLAKKPWIDFSREGKLRCRWMGCPNEFTTEQELFQHAVHDHLPTGLGMYTCQWLSCRRFVLPTNDRQAVIKHLRTHFPLTPSVKPFSNRPRWFDMRPTILEVPGRELAGVPLTAVVTLRNLSRHKRNQKYFLPYEESLARIMGEFPKMAGFIVDILSNLRVG